MPLLLKCTGNSNSLNALLPFSLGLLLVPLAYVATTLHPSPGGYCCNIQLLQTHPHRQDTEESGVLNVSAAFNSLNLVMRDEGLMKFIKYLGCDAPSSRWDLIVCCIRGCCCTLACMCELTCAYNTHTGYARTQHTHIHTLQVGHRDGVSA